MKTLRITLPAAAEDYNHVPNFRNFGEDIHCHFISTGIAHVPDMDSATTELHVVISATRHLGSVTSYVNKAIRRYGLSDLVHVTRIDRSEHTTP